MEWLVPILFVLASLVQWWMQRNRQGQERENPEVPPASARRDRSIPPRREPDPQQEFGDLGDLLEALGRRRHEPPPPPVEQTEPPVLPAPAPKTTNLPKREPAPAPRLEPVIILETPKPAPAPVLAVFPEPKPSLISEPTAVFVEPATPRVTFRSFPPAEKSGASIPHRWAEKLGSPASVRDAIVLSEILAPPVSLR